MSKAKSAPASTGEVVTVACKTPNGIVLRLEGREVETTGVKAILDRHERALALLGRRLDELEGAPKG